MKELRTGFTFDYINEKGYLVREKVKKEKIKAIENSKGGYTLFVFSESGRIFPLNYVKEMVTKNGSGVKIDSISSKSINEKGLFNLKSNDFDSELKDTVFNTWRDTNDAWFENHMLRLVTKQVRNSIYKRILDFDNLEVLDKKIFNYNADRITRSKLVYFKNNSDKTWINVLHEIYDEILNCSVFKKIDITE